ncbi:hydroxyacylglutathione hydrolase [Eikenella sp. S3360]|uniref:Hydroxyacylglutathione hydrolase n=1 Tax=Eikenella glucosivorans TaxID=2766967 RepID=A0ABS0N9K1_9NEIS|nr:hydroxyacylglutathione hydrolase [Eikenella glucosivorans]MBH5328979.1 hydroxyacylglutathione hydrolase [Eikenella glucosivorans]
MQILPIPALADNYIWLLHQGSEAVCIDPGEAAPVLGYLKNHNLSLRQIWVTHHHDDHTGGLAELRRHFPDCAVYGNRDIPEATETAGEGSHWPLWQGQVRVWHTPGHTDSHLSYLLQDNDQLHVFCGDTLFSAGCGRVFTGTIGQLFASLQRFNRLPEHTLFYPAHEYTAANLRFAAHIELHNPAIARSLQAAANIPTLPVSLAHERQINPFLRTADFQVAARAAELSGQTLANEEQVFAALRELKNRF